ncbi:hypothetical protein N7532_008964 [Penicillium argentinense]|uniref:Uncharacterized protein n=1 Tax=Penicillium argentinense TaxID=1131581 RepID=A0A9W9EYQ5_9EURO|nr:uncharacterized protein N7532_008964 [Penicillium argentinense]KAJ5090280.1 hypothetical protein N7532_008964 [Penicillium argentinense]
MGSIDQYSVPKEAQRVLEEGILQNPLMASLPQEMKDLSQHVRFEGSNEPLIPINWRFAESISAVKAFEATMLNYLLCRKYKIDPVEIVINTNHASLFFMSPLIAKHIKDGVPTPVNLFSPELQKLFPSQDKHRAHASLHRTLATNIYKTKDGRYYHIHGNLNPEPALTALGLPLEGEENDTYESVVERIQKAVSQFESKELDELMNDKFRTSGTVAWDSVEYFASDHGKASGKVGLYEIMKDESSAQQPSWWPENESLPSSPKRPLAGLKVVDLTRIIAGPTITRSLAEMGASVMRVVSPHVTDMSGLFLDLNWGKWNTFLHLKDEADKEKLRDLIRDADVVVDGYRPGVMDRMGFSRQDIYDLVKDRPRGILHLRENCYGWHGPWSHRSGWQQISDACCGVSRSYAQAMGLDEAVTPVFPNSDYCTGAAGCTAVLEALVRRAKSGGSYGIDVSLNYYSQWLVRSCGTYDNDTWKELWSRHGNLTFHHYHAMGHQTPAMLNSLYEHDRETLFNLKFFETRNSESVNAQFVRVKPIAQFPDKEVELKYNVGTRGNGVDQPVWPKDLTVETVTGPN